jgi:hypothetical protein
MSSNCNTRYAGSLNSTKPINRDPSVVLILVLVYVALSQHGPHILVSHVIFLFVSPSLFFSSVSLWLLFTRAEQRGEATVVATFTVAGPELRCTGRKASKPA